MYNLTKIRKKLPVIGCVGLIIIYSLYIIDMQNRKYFNSQLSEYKSKCSCRQNENILLNNNTVDYSELTQFTTLTVYLTNSDLTKNIYNVTQNELNSFTCGIYNTLRRGKKQKIIGFSLYGKEQIYYDLIKGYY